MGFEPLKSGRLLNKGCHLMVETILTLLELEGVYRKRASVILSGMKGETGPSALAEAASSLGLFFREEEIRRARERAREILILSDRLGITVLTREDEGYPSSFLEMRDPPLVLFAKGNTGLLREKKSLGVIGCRAPSPKGVRKGREMSRGLSEEGWSLVSGLASGCDTAGHWGALDKSGRTVAFLPSGLCSLFPRENKYLAARIASEGGLLVSEYPPYEPPQKYRFIERDRLQSGLSRGLFIIETEETGGTFHTVRFAEELMKPVFCLEPGPEHLPSQEGNRRLIASGRAEAVHSSEELIDKTEALLMKKEGRRAAFF